MEPAADPDSIAEAVQGTKVRGRYGGGPGGGEGTGQYVFEGNVSLKGEKRSVYPHLLERQDSDLTVLTGRGRGGAGRSPPLGCPQPLQEMQEPLPEITGVTEEGPHPLSCAPGSPAASPAGSQGSPPPSSAPLFSGEQAWGQRLLQATGLSQNLITVLPFYLFL